MLLNQHKNFVLVGLTALGVALTVGMAAIGSQIDFFNAGAISDNQLASVGIVNAKTSNNPSSEGLKSENINFEFKEPESSAARRVNENALSTLGYALRNANEKEPTIFNVHGVTTKWKSKDLEFMFESLSPTDYESKVFNQAFTPFTRLANTAGFDGVKFLSTIGENGSRSVVVKTKIDNDKITEREAEDLWHQMLLVLAPISAHTSYDLTLDLANGVTVHGDLSTEAEQNKLMEYDANENLEAAIALNAYVGVKHVDIYVQGQDAKDNTVALTIPKTDKVADYVSKLTAYAGSAGNKFPHAFTTTITVEGEATPAHVFYPER